MNTGEKVAPTAHDARTVSNSTGDDIDGESRPVFRALSLRTARTPARVLSGQEAAKHIDRVIGGAP